MTHRDTEIVSAVCTCLRARLGDERFELWLGNDYRFSWSDSTLRIDVDSAFRADRLRAKLQSDVVESIRSVVGGEFQLSVGVDTHLGRAEGESTESSESSSERRRTGNGNERSACDASEAGHEPSATPQETQSNSAPSWPRVASDTRSENAGRRWGRSESAGRKFASFRTLVRGTSNQVACHSAQIVIDQPGQVTPLFFHGPSGCGKTHLLEGIWSEVRRRGGRRIIYLSAEQFTTYFLQALRGSGLPSFRQKYRAVDLFVLDDVQFFAGKQATVTELLHTMDSLLRESRQLVLAADRPPAELQGLGSDLQARIAGGLVCGIQPLDSEMRKTVLDNLAAQRSMPLSAQVRDLVAERTSGDARQLAGVINRLWATGMSLGYPPPDAMIDEILAELCPDASAIVNLQDIQRVVCDEFGLEPEQLCSNRRTRDVSHPRMLAMWLARKHTRAALTEIGEFFGRRSHSTVVSAQNKVDRWVNDGEQLSLTQHQGDVKLLLSRLERSLRA